MTRAPKDSQPAAQVSPNETTTEVIRPAGLPGSEPEAPVSSSPADTPAIPARSLADDAAPEGGAVADAARTKPVRPAGLAGLRIQIGSLRDSSLVPKPKPQPIHESERQARSEPPSAVERETSGPEAADKIPPGAPARTRILPPNVRDRLSPELEREVAAALGSMSLDQLIDGTGTDAGEDPIEPESQIEGRVVAVGREELFLDLGGRNQGVMPLRQFDTPPEPGATLDVIVHRFDPEDGLYEVSLPGAAADVSDWSQVTEGLIVDATITGHNTGGLECQVGSLQGFIPLSQVSLYRVEDVDEYIGQKFSCLVTQANPFRRNLVLSRRAVLERECAEARQRLWEELEVGQTREGVVRNLKEFGAFVDLGGVDGLIHISQLSWDRIGHPSEVLELGQKVRVKIQQIDRTEGKISLAYRDLSENPWTGVARKYPVSSCVNGTVVKIMDFGALVRLEPGIVGLIHISELSHARVWRVADVVHVGQEVEVKVLSVDADGQRIGLSRRALELPPEVEKEQARSEERMAAAVEEGGMKLPKTAPQQLKGGLGRSAGGERFGLKW